MKNGGFRPGAGRKTAAIRAQQRKSVSSVLDADMTPMAVMHRAMMEHVGRKAWDEAAKQAKELAPYVHPRLAAIAHEGPEGGAIEFSIDGLMAVINGSTRSV